MNVLAEWSGLVPILALAIPGTLVLCALVSPRHARLASGAALALALLVAVGAGLTRGGPATMGSSVGVRVDLVTCVMLLLVGAMGAIIARYSRPYLDGDPGLNRYQRWLLLTLGAVTALVVANNLVVLAVGWTATSLALHQLLTFYADRPAALVAAHKKFLVSRLADVCLLGALVLIQGTVGSLDLDELAAWASARPELTPSMQLAAVLIVLAVALRTAQLPFHGWLIQVMEAPTPVSALLHAGVVNIGGFVLIRLSPWMVHAELALLLCVIIGMVSTVVAALVMTTRISVKVALAWSTCAQMGFMLVQCGLGLWHLALLHLVAHSLYKAHAFLSAGTTVADWRVQAQAPRAPSPSWIRLGAGVLMAVGAALLIAALCGQVSWSPEHRSGTPLAVLSGLAVVPLLVRPASGPRVIPGLVLRLGAVILLYAGWHAGAAQLLPSPVEGSHELSWVLVGLGFAVLFTVKTVLQRSPQGRLARALYPWLFAGLYLDERFTRFTFRVWPPRLQRRVEPVGKVELPEGLEVRS